MDEMFLSVPRCGDAISWTLERLDEPGAGVWAAVRSNEICPAHLRMSPLLLEPGDDARGGVPVPEAGRYRIAVRYARAIDSHTAARVATSAPFDVR
jgi:hypothetical protein